MLSLELFSGAGGLALGLEQAGFEHVGLVECNRDAVKTLQWNRPEWKVLEEDVRRISFRDFGTVDLIAGGPPCQPFSIGGKARGYDDTRDMFPQAVRAVHELQPRAFMFENVRGLMRQSFRNYVEYIRLQMTYPDVAISGNIPWEQNLQRLQKHHTDKYRESELTYRVTVHVADAADYGVPQRRHRVFFVGFRSDLDPAWFFPTPTHSYEELLRAKYVTGSYWEEHRIATIRTPPVALARRIDGLRTKQLIEPTQRWKTVRDALYGLPHPRGSHAVRNHSYQPGARVYPGHTGSPLDEPSKALKAGDHGVPGGENMLAYPTGEVRYFSVRESARIQTFPDDYEFLGSWTEAMRQLGNAVPVALARAVAFSIFLQLEKTKGKRPSVQSSR